MRTKIILGEKTECYENIKRGKNKVLIFNITTQCNSNCIHCYNTKFDRARTIPDLNFEHVKSILSQARKMGVEGIVFTGGEPLVRKDFFDILKIAKDLGFFSTVASNGYLLNEKNIEKLKNLDVTRIQISLDGFEKTNDYLRGYKGHFRKVIENIGKLIANNFYVGISSVIMEKNYEEIPELFSFFEKKGISDYRVMRYIPLSSTVPNSYKIYLFDLYLNVLKNIFEKIKTKSYLIEVEEPPLAIISIVPESLKNKVIYKHCRTLHNTITLESDGTLSVCPIFIKDIKFGKVDGGNFKETIEMKYEEAKQYKDLKKYCGSCEYFEQCKGGCRCSAFYNCGNPELPDPFCIKHRRLIK